VSQTGEHGLERRLRSNPARKVYGRRKWQRAELYPLSLLSTRVTVATRARESCSAYLVVNLQQVHLPALIGDLP
jgi:hypothetical protein